MKSAAYGIRGREMDTMTGSAQKSEDVVFDEDGT
jgi:hypothetical protein